MRIGILGGSFNPIHLGHLVMAETARQKFGLSKVLFIPYAEPPHKKDGELAGAAFRFQMVQKAVADNPAFEACDLEIVRGGKSYSYDTLRHLTQACPRDDFYFIVGADSLAHIRSWYRVEELKGLCRFIVVDRPGVRTQELLDEMSPRDRDVLGAHRVGDFMLGISSKQIRDRIQKGLSVRYLVPQTVEDHLSRAGVYQEGKDR